MFTRTENHFLASSDPNAVLGAVNQALMQRGVGQAMPMANGLTIQAPPAGNSVNPRITVMAFPAHGGMQLQLQIKGDIDSNGMTMMVLMMFLFWPVSLYLWYMANQSFNNAATDLMNTMRYALTPFMQQAPDPYGQTQSSYGQPPGGPHVY